MSEKEKKTPATNTPSSSSVTEAELWLLSYYRASELDAALVCAKVARLARSPDLQQYMTRQCAEEAHHAWMLTDLIQRLGAAPVPVEETYQALFNRRAGLPTSLLQFLVLGEVAERRAIAQYQGHLATRGVNPHVAETLRQIVSDEDRHIESISDALAHLSRGKNRAADELRERYRQADREIFKALVLHHASLSGDAEDA